jgi:opacity protein-like surface antigen
MSRFRIMIGLAGLFLLGTASAKAQAIQGVQADVSNPLQIGVDYSFASFDEASRPRTILNSSGVTGSVVYYGAGGFLGVEGQVSDVFGSSNGRRSQLVFGGGGARFRWPNRSLQPWAHVVLGGAYLTPQPPFGNNSAFGYKLGGGVDYNPHHSHMAFRLSVDMLGSAFFKTYQVSPEVSVGVVFMLHGPR